MVIPGVGPKYPGVNNLVEGIQDFPFPVPKKIPESDLERVLLHLLLQGYMKESFQVNSYATNSYLIPGSRGSNFLERNTCEGILSGDGIVVDPIWVEIVEKLENSNLKRKRIKVEEEGGEKEEEEDVIY